MLWRGKEEELPTAVSAHGQIAFDANLLNAHSGPTVQTFPPSTSALGSVAAFPETAIPPTSSLQLATDLSHSCQTRV